MIVARTRTSLHEARARLPEPVGVVPTMGALHRGHFALLRAARRRERSVVATLFVNQTQFNDPSDYDAYPRDEAADLAAFKASGVDLVFAPSTDEMYPAGFGTRIDPGPIGADLEGARRPGHFAGVATVVAKLFNLTRPTRAYLGQKDWQQTRVIDRMVKDLNLPVDLVIVPTVRDPDGLALSSRNVRLTPDQRQAALSLWRGLSLARDAWDDDERSPTALADLLKSMVQAEPLAELGYAEVRHALTLEPVTAADPPLVIAVAAEIGGVGLIDNVVLGEGLVGEAEVIDLPSAK
ncbi:MAG: pantoate--beta-alanine ligase [Chloroflexota bacterium]|nr:pantoate--beta-alanine ligase [Chloroflexota bacterium]MDE2921212.1 pantoate--beta-alanine ligase [Chloroflexota bacterium]